MLSALITIGNLSRSTASGAVKKGLFTHHPGLIASLIAVFWKEEGASMVMKSQALILFDSISEINGLEQFLYEHEGLIALLVDVIGKEGGEWEFEKENALVVIGNITCCASKEMKKGLYEVEGLIASLVAVVGKEGEEWEEEREKALMVIVNIAESTAEAKRGLFEFPDLMLSLEK